MRFIRSTAAVAAVAAAMLSQNASAVNITTDGIGEVAIAPYYTVRANKQTLINLTNTTNSQVAVKVRFHEASNSRDVLDFVVALSANDVFVATVFLDPVSGQPRLRSNDSVNAAGLTTCTVPQLQATGLTTGGAALAPFRTAGYFGDNPNNTDDGAVAPDATRLQEGYVEFIVLGSFDSTLRQTGAAAFDNGAVAGYDALGANKLMMVGQAIERHDCATVVSAFTEPNVLNTAKQAGQPVNSLKFNFSIIDAAGGIEAGSTATTWANFYNPPVIGGDLAPAVGPGANIACTVHRGRQRSTGLAQQPIAGDWFPNGSVAGAAPDLAGSCRNLIAAQQSPQFLEPTLNDAYPAVATYQDDDRGVWVSAFPTYHTGSALAPRAKRGVDAVSATIMRERIINEWSINPNLGVSTDWIVTQPTKLFYVDQGSGDQFAVIGARNDAIGANGIPDTFVPRVNGGFQLRPTAYLAFNNAAGGAPELAPYKPYSQTFGPRSINGATVGASCSAVTYSIFDRAEQSPPGVTGDVDFSPAPPLDLAPANLCFETTVVTFGVPGDATNPTALGAGLNRLHLSVANLPDSKQVNGPNGPNTSGWASLTLYSTDANAPASPNAYLPLTLLTATASDVGVVAAAAAPQVNNPPVDATALTGLPVIGFSLKTRSFPNRADLSFANNSDHSYIRNYAAPAALTPNDGAAPADQP